MRFFAKTCLLFQVADDEFVRETAVTAGPLAKVRSEAVLYCSGEWRFDAFAADGLGRRTRQVLAARCASLIRFRTAL